MKNFICLALLFICACEAQPNRPLTAIDKIDRVNNYKPVSPLPNNNQNPSSAPVANNPTPAPTASPFVADPNATKVLFKGQIFDIQTKAPLGDVTLNIDNTKYQTDNEGKFSIPDFPIGIHEFIASKDGYIDYLSSMDIKYDFGSAYIYMRKKS